jgi:hypothetical protein
MLADAELLAIAENLARLKLPPVLHLKIAAAVVAKGRSGSHVFSLSLSGLALEHDSMITKAILFCLSKSEWIIGGIVVIAIAYVLVTEPEKNRREIEAYCTLYPTSVWYSTAGDFGEQHSVDCAEWNRQANEADAYCMAHHDGVWESPHGETHRYVDCRRWLEE